ncbi:MFS transporter [Streptomyces piniterrae]|uniref:MFS transporter n=1 Tax=Streptomyces piniterrae TaxID=2571125 RepID=A0A4U0NY84_9ACTN|nr:MFS transporter [Streptomyces piniterrae]TJZ59162.1 MFS transporter [Streptomyces piniterrae]
MSGVRRSALIGPVLVLATLVSSIVSSFGAPLIPTVAQDFDVSLSTAQWSLTVALLVGTVGSPVLGRLGDGPGRRATLLGGLAVVTAGGVVAALADGMGMLLVGRGLQGVGLGLAPLAIATARDALPQAKVAPTIALLSVSAAAGLGAGYPISGLIAGTWGLSGAYWFGTVVSGLTLACVAVIVPPSRERHDPGRLDWPGAVLLALALVSAMVGVSQGSEWGWGSPAITGLLVAGALLLVIWSVQQLRAASPLVRLRLLRHPSVLSGDACALVLGAAMYMVLTGMTEFVQSPRSGGFGFSASALVAGLVLIPLSVLMFASSRVLPSLVARMGIRALLTLGCLVAALGSGFFALFHGSLWQAFVMTGILGVGLGTTFAAIPGLITQSVPARETGSAIGFFQVLRFVGYSLGSALTATVLATHLGGTGHPTESGYTSVLWTSTGICVVAAALAWFLPAGSPQPTPTEETPTESDRARTGADDDEPRAGAQPEQLECAHEEGANDGR